MERLPDPLSEAVGDAVVIDTVDIGGGDAVVVAAQTTYLYRSEGLLRDESVETFDHEAERLSVRTKRRKSSITLEAIGGESEFTVPSDAADGIVEAMARGVLVTNGVVDPDEEITALFRFSELTVVVTERRLFEHVGGAVWDGDFETVEYAELTGLDFERGSVATQVVLETADRRRRVKVPNEHAGTVRRTIEEAVFGFHGVGSIEALRDEIAVPDDEADPSAPGPVSAGTDGNAGPGGSTRKSKAGDREGFASPGWSPRDDGARDGNSASEGTTPPADDTTETPEPRDDRNGTAGETDVDALAERVEGLSERIDRQTELIESQQELLERLVDELRRGR